jgi:serine/threonine protein kinase
MAPEQIEGREADARTDLWAFGCLLYEMVSGRRAFDGATSASLIAAILEREPTPIPQNNSLPHRLRAVIRTCLEKDLLKLQTA